MIKIPGFLFDNDGVLIDSQRLHWLAWHQCSEEYDLGIDYSKFLEGFGKRNETFLNEVAPTSDNREKGKWANRKEEIFRASARGKIQLIEGMEDFLKELKNENFPRIIASSASVENLEMFVSSTVLGTYFSEFISAEQVPHGKPFPDIFKEAAYRLGLLPQECIVIEDSPAGLEAGMRAGCFVIALATTHQKETLSNFHLLVNSPKDLNLKRILDSFSKWKP